MYVLQLFKEPTLLFSRAEVPLVSNTLPMIQELEESLNLVRDDLELSKVMRVAAHASLMLLQKYHSLSDECEVYRISIGMFYSIYRLNMLYLTLLLIFLAMCPDKKLQWFEDHGYDSEDVEEVRKLVINRWNESYKPEEGIREVAAAAAAPRNIPTKVNRIKDRQFECLPFYI